MISLFIRQQKAVLALFVLLLAGSLWVIPDLGFEHVHHDFVPSGNDDFEFLTHINEQVEPDDNAMIVAVDHGKSILDTAFLQHFDDFTKACSEIPWIISTNSITTLSEPVKGPFGFIEVPFIHPDNPEKLAADSARIAADHRIRGTFVSDDFQVAAVIMKTVPVPAQDTADSVCAYIDSLILDFGFEKAHVAGKANMQSTFVSKAQGEVIFYISLFSLLILVMLSFIYRAVWGVVIPLVAVNAGFVFFLGYFWLSGQTLNILSTLFPTLMLIFGMADVIHLQTKYIDLMEAGHDRIGAMKIAMKEIGLALFLTSVTTGIGFATLLTSQIKAIRFFGFNSAIGVMVAYFTIVVFASMALLLCNHDQLSRARRQFRFWQRLLDWCYAYNHRANRGIYVITAVVIGLSIWGITMISTNSYLVGDFPRSGKLRTDYQFMEQRFNGSRSIEIAIMPKGEHTVIEPEVLDAIDRLEAHLMRSEGIRALYTPATFYKTMHKAHNDGQLDSFVLSENPKTLQRYTRMMERNQNFLDELTTSKDRKLGRMTGKIPDLGSDSIALQNDRIHAWIAGNIDSNLVQFRFTGLSLLIDRNNSYTINSLGMGLLLAILMVGVIFAYLFKDYRLVVISLIPNVLPLIITGGVMGFLGIELKAVTSVIFTVSFGIAVDDTIHFLTRYKLERKKGLGVEESMRNTFQISGKAIILTTLVLLVGFISLVFSSFSGTYYIGLLVSVTLVSAVISDLFLIPQLLYWINPREPKPAGVSRTDESHKTGANNP